MDQSGPTRRKLRSSGWKISWTLCRIPVRPFDYIVKAGQNGVTIHMGTTKRANTGALAWGRKAADACRAPVEVRPLRAQPANGLEAVSCGPTLPSSGHTVKISFSAKLLGIEICAPDKG